jgi:AcrR family transcriptional regulator
MSEIIQSERLPAAPPVTPEKATRNRDRTRAQILKAATMEFAQKGYDGARVEQIAARAETNKRMLYYYFQNKDELFQAVMEESYRSIREAERDLRLLEQPPIEAIRTLVTFTWDYYIEHPEFLGLLNSENFHRASHLRSPARLQTLNSPLIDTLQEVLLRGQREHVFRNGIDPLQLYISMAALSYFYLSNNHTLSAIFARDLASPKARVQRIQHILDVVLGYVLAN